MQVLTFTWVGNASNPRSFSGFGFAPKIIFAGAGLQIARGTGWTAARLVAAVAGGDQANTIVSLDSDGFTVQAGLNAGGTTYWAYGFGGSDVDSGEYTGDGGGNKNISTVINPDYVGVISNDAAKVPGWMQVLSNAFGAGLAADWRGSAPPQASYINSIGAGTFQVGTNMNTNLVKYGWFAYTGNTGGFIKEQTYAGDNSNPRTFSPGIGTLKLVLIRRTDGSAGAAVRTVDMPSGQDILYPLIPLQTTGILNFPSGNTFTTDNTIRVNQSAINYVYFAYVHQPAAVALPTAPVPLPGAFGQSGVSTLPFNAYGRYKNTRQAVQVFNDLSIAP